MGMGVGLVAQGLGVAGEIMNSRKEAEVKKEQIMQDGANTREKIRQSEESKRCGLRCLTTVIITVAGMFTGIKCLENKEKGSEKQEEKETYISDVDDM